MFQAMIDSEAKHYTLIQRQNTTQCPIQLTCSDTQVSVLK